MTGLLYRAQSAQVAGAVVVTGLLIGLASTYDPRYCVVGVAGIALVAMTMLNVTYGVVALTLLAFFERLPGLSGVTLSKPLGLVLVVSWLASLARRGARMPLLTRDQPLLSFFLVGLVVWGACSASWATDPYASLTAAVRLSMVVVLLFIVYSAVQTQRDLLLVTWAFLIGAFLISVASLASGRTVEGRLSGGVLDPNYLAAALASSIVVASFLLPAARPRTRTVLLSFVGTFAVALVLTQSRGGLVAAAAALFLACIIAGPVRAQTIALVVVIGSVGLTYFAVLAPASLRQRVTDVSAQGSASRTDTWHIAIQIMKGHPLQGAGLANFPTVEAQYIPGNINLIRAPEVLNSRLVVHNTYLELLAELGGVGFVLFLAVVAGSVAAAWGGIKQMAPSAFSATLTARGLVSGTLGLLVAYIFLSGEYEKQLWLLLGLLVAIPNVARNTAPS